MVVIAISFRSHGLYFKINKTNFDICKKNIRKLKFYNASAKRLVQKRVCHVN